jgi:hypothetical protein
LDKEIKEHLEINALGVGVCVLCLIFLIIKW